MDRTQLEHLLQDAKQHYPDWRYCSNVQFQIKEALSHPPAHDEFDSLFVAWVRSQSELSLQGLVDRVMKWM